MQERRSEVGLKGVEGEGNGEGWAFEDGVEEGAGVAGEGLF